MALWDQVKTRTQAMNDQLKTKSSQFRNKEFANASMAMCALISAADGTIDATERRRTAALIASNEVLSVFSPDELRMKFDWFCDKLEKDYDFGKIEAIATIAKLKSKPEQARAVISIGLIIGAADGNFDADEQRAVKEACFAVGIAPAEFDL
jgi:tellurite resistance protein TerB